MFVSSNIYYRAYNAVRHLGYDLVAVVCTLDDHVYKVAGRRIIESSGIPSYTWWTFNAQMKEEPLFNGHYDIASLESTLVGMTKL